MSDHPQAHCEFDASKLLVRLDMRVEATHEAVRGLINKITGN